MRFLHAAAQYARHAICCHEAFFMIRYCVKMATRIVKIGVNLYCKSVCT